MRIEFSDLGLVYYKDSYKAQLEAFNRVKEGIVEHALLSCSHFPVITLGRQAKTNNLLVSERELKEKGVELFNIERGGDITYHGPGQLTAYPVFNLNLLKKDLHLFLRNLEQVIIGTLACFNLKAEQRKGLTGVWVEGKKIASIGISVRQWISFHGLSINIKDDDLANFSLIRPCGMDIMITSMESVLNKPIEIGEVEKIFKQEILKWPK